MRLLLVNLSDPNMNRRYTKKSEYKYGISLFTVERNKIKKNHRNSLKKKMKADNLYIAKEIGIGWTNFDFFHNSLQRFHWIYFEEIIVLFSLRTFHQNVCRCNFSYILNGNL